MYLKSANWSQKNVYIIVPYLFNYDIINKDNIFYVKKKKNVFLLSCMRSNINGSMMIKEI